MNRRIKLTKVTICTAEGPEAYKLAGSKDFGPDDEVEFGVNMETKTVHVRALTRPAPPGTREQRHQAALVVFQEWMAMRSPEKWIGKDGGAWSLAAAERGLADAQRRLDDIRKAMAYRQTVDTLLPGWTHIDAGDDLPEALWYAFISDDGDEWLDWLIEQGVDEDRARQLVWPGLD